MNKSTKKYIVNQNGNNHPHVGGMVSAILKKKHWYSAALARDIGRSLSTLMEYYRKPSMQTAILWELSLAMKHNFFADIAVQLPADYSGALQDALAEKDQQIAALHNEMAALARERDIYKDLLKR
jgi:hypothetical protein